MGSAVVLELVAVVGLGLGSAEWPGNFTVKKHTFVYIIVMCMVHNIKVICHFTSQAWWIRAMTFMIFDVLLYDFNVYLVHKMLLHVLIKVSLVSSDFIIIPSKYFTKKTKDPIAST